MDIFTDDPEFPDIHVVQKVVNMFDGKPHMQRIITCGLFGMEYRDELDDTGEDDDFEHWAHGHSSFHGYGRLPGRSDGRGFHRNPSSSVYHPPLHYYTSAHEPSHPAVKVQAKENDTERKTRLLQESKKCKNKAEKKRLKKQKQKERKQREKLEKEKQNPAKNEEQKDDTQQSDAEENEAGKDEGDTNSSVKLSASAKDTDTSDSSENESSDEDRDTKNDSSNSEGLDMRSTFVSKAALIAMRKLEQKPRAEKKEKKKTPEKEERKSVPDDPNKGEEDGKKDSAAPSSATFEENVKISTNLANFGNKYASAGEFSMAVKYFTDAIKYNPTEFKLFGNRSFCFEKLQEYDKALTDAELSLGICPGWVKGLFRKGRALAGLKRYEEATQAFREVLKMDSSCAEAAQELMRVQITQLMDFGFTREQSSNALIIHGTVEKALEVLSKLNIQPGVTQNGAIQPAQVVNITGVSPVLSANTTPAAAAAAAAAPSQDAPKQTHTNKPLGPVHNTSNVQSQSKPVYPRSVKTSDDGDQPPPELFPVWVGNLNYLVTESMIINLFTKAGVVYSAKVLVSKRCAFVNFTKQEYCDEAIRRFNGYELNGIKMVVRYPDRIPPGMGISKSALRAEDLQDENVRHSEYDDGRNAAGNRRFVRPYKHVQNYRGNY